MKQFRNIRRSFAALFAIVLIIALAGSTAYAAEKASYPDFKYAVSHMTRYHSDLPDSDMLSMDKAAEAGAKYIYDLYGEKGDGNAMWMSYMSFRNQWAGRVTKADSELKAGNIIFSFIIDAENGKRIRIYDMRGIGADKQERSMTGEELAKFKAKIPDKIDEYKKLAAESAQKHFYDDKVASLDYYGVGPMNMNIIEIEPTRDYYYTEMCVRFIATDSAGRASEIAISMDTGKLREISAYTSEEEKEAMRAERQSKAEPGRTVIIGN